MVSLRDVHQYMNHHRRVLLADGRTGKVVRVDTVFPANETTVAVWTERSTGSGLAKIVRVKLRDVVGLAPQASKPAP